MLDEDVSPIGDMGRSVSTAALRMRRYRARLADKTRALRTPHSERGQALKTAMSAKDVSAVDSVPSVTLSAPFHEGTNGDKRALETYRANPAELPPKALQPDCPCDCHYQSTDSLEPLPIPSPANPEPPERRRLIEEHKARIRAGRANELTAEDRRVFPDWVVRVVERRAATAAQCSAVHRHG